MCEVPGLIKVQASEFAVEEATRDMATCESLFLSEGAHNDLVAIVAAQSVEIQAFEKIVQKNLEIQELSDKVILEQARVIKNQKDMIERLNIDLEVKNGVF
jgi:hypothetical protein